MGRKTTMNRNSPEDLKAKINPKNIELMNEFLEYLATTSKSRKTIAAYRIDILGAFCWNVEHNDNRFFVDWTKRQVIKYQNYMINVLGNSPKRVIRIKAVLSSLSNFIENIMDDEYPNFRNIIKKVENPVNEPVRTPTVLSNDQVQELFVQLTTEGKVEQACMFALALYSGKRLSELVQFKVTDFTPEHLVCNGALYKTDPVRAKGRGVNGKQLECFVLAKKFKPYLDEWLLERSKQGIDSIWLFPDLEDPTQHMRTTRLASWSKKFSKRLGVDFYWHCVRHKACTMFLEIGIPTTIVKEYFGWESIEMVSVYNDMPVDSQLSMYFDGSTEDGIKVKAAGTFNDL